MKKLYFLFIVLVGSISVSAQIINFPDPNFKAKLLQPNVAYDFGMEFPMTIDANNDGEIEVSEAQAVEGLGISNANISDLTGISNFTNLKTLYCSNNLLQTLAIDPAIGLYILDASHNLITDIDVRFESCNFQSINLSYNNLTEFTMPTVESAYYDYDVNLSHNQLSTLNLNNASVGQLNVSYNNLSSLNGSAYIYSNVNFRNNQFSLLDLTQISFGLFCSIALGNNTVDKVLFGSSCPNNLSYSSLNTFFDIGNYFGSNYCDNSAPGEKGYMYIQNCPNLNFISFKNGYSYTMVTCDDLFGPYTIDSIMLSITNCPNLSFMCVDEQERDYIKSKINALGLQNQVQVNSYCSFTPGGTYYTINGTTKFDANGNGCDGADSGIPNFKYAIVNSTNSGEMISNASGNYTMPLEPGAYTITPLLENPSYFNVSPQNLVVDFPTNTSPLTQNFCVTPIGTHADLEITAVPIGSARPGFDAKYKIVYQNKGNQTQSGDITLSFDDAISDFVTAGPTVASQAANLLTWNFTDLAPFESREILITLNLNSPMEVPPVNGGAILNYNVAINSAATDETPANNVFILHQTVVNSFDPNDKNCLEGDTVTPDMIGKDVHYMIRFENTGTANAENVVVKDMIDTSKFDVDSLIPIEASHPFVTRINGNKVEFIFENINLPFDDANNDGYVVFKIKSKPTLVLGDTFSNTASIYFDYNFPIVTNTATTTVALLAKTDFAFENYFSVYPNPANSILNIETKKQIEVVSLSIYNTLGQLVLVIPNAKDIKSVDVSGLKAGNYFIKINSDKGSSNAKFIKL